MPAGKGGEGGGKSTKAAKAPAKAAAAEMTNPEAAMATTEATEAEAARLGAEVALPLVQARSFSAGLATHATRAPVTNLTLTLTRCRWS